MPGQDEQDNATARVPGSAEQDFVSEALETFKQAFDDESDIRQEAAIDLKFVAGEQWDPEVERKRNANNRPALTFGHLFSRELLNKLRLIFDH